MMAERVGADADTIKALAKKNTTWKWWDRRSLSGGETIREHTLYELDLGHARSLAPVIAEIRATGVHSYRGIAAQLDTRDIPTAHGGRWATTQVRDIVVRSPK
jgi:hypothetical protein